MYNVGGPWLLLVMLGVGVLVYLRARKPDDDQGDEAD